MTIKQNIIANFNRGAATYEQAARLQRTVVQGLKPYLQRLRPKAILEIGCGTGMLSQLLIEHFPTADVLLTDIAPNMIQYCDQRFQQQTRITCLCIDGESFQHEASFDLIISSMTLHWFQHFEKSLLALKKCLKKNGRLILAMLGQGSLSMWRQLCAQNNINAGTPIFPDLHHLMQQFPQMNWQHKIIYEKYANLREFLQSLKLLGATSTQAGYQPLSVAQLRQLMRAHQQSIAMDYHVIYGEYQQL